MGNALLNILSIMNRWGSLYLSICLQYYSHNNASVTEANKESLENKNRLPSNDSFQYGCGYATNCVYEFLK